MVPSAAIRNGTRVIEPVDVLLVEGTLVLYQKELCDLMFMKVFIDEDSDERLARRVRKTKVRNGRVLTIKELLMEYVEKVKPMYEEYILPVRYIFCMNFCGYLLFYYALVEEMGGYRYSQRRRKYYCASSHDKSRRRLS